MMPKRLISVLLAMCLLLCMIPAAALPVWAETPSGYLDEDEQDQTVNWQDPVYTVSYRPEYALFNAITGDSEDYFQSVMKSSQYNAVVGGEFLRQNTSDAAALKYDSEITGYEAYVWNDFRNTNLAKLSDGYDQLKAGLAATLTNKDHKHSSGLKSWRVISSCTLEFTHLVGTIGYNSIYTAKGFSKDQTTVRRGNAAFRDLPADMYNVPGDDSAKGHLLAIECYDELVSWGSNSSESCSCSGTARNFVVSFCDSTLPQVETVRVLKNGTEDNSFGRGDTVTLEIKCSEPLRFADDSRKDKGKVCVALMVEGKGQGDWLYAHLTKLENDTLTFEYEIDASDTKLYSVNGVDFSAAREGCTPLIHSEADVTLKTLKGSSSFTAQKPKSASDDEGYSKASSVITDIAGNPFTEKQVWTQLYIDCESPYAALVSVNADTDNADVKAARGVTGGQPNVGNYDDNSDVYLGVGDMIGFYVYLNERTYWGRTEGCDINNAKVITNLKRNGRPVEFYLTGWYMPVQASTIGSQYGKGQSYGYIDKLSTQRIWISSDLTVDDPEGIIRVTGMRFEGSGIMDASDNYAEDHTAKADRQYKLDVTPPVYELGTAIQPGGTNSAFCVPFRITDEGGSGVSELPASLWISDPDGNTGAIGYAVTASSAAPSAWSEGTMGCEISFTQTGDWQYLHVKPAEDAHFDLGSGESFRITFRLSDYAGNRVDTAAAKIEGIDMDSVAPVVTAGKVNKRYSGGRGTLYAALQVSDRNDVAAVEFQWADAGSGQDSLSDAWTPAEQHDGDPTAVATVDSGSSFRKDLWVRAEDRSGNSGITCLGTYTYSLESIEYILDYSPAVATAAGLSVSSLESGGSLLFDVQKEGSDIHYVKVVNGASSADLFGEAWEKGTFSSDENGYTIAELSDAGPFLNGFTGNVGVTVYSGSSDMLSYTTGAAITVTKNAGIEHFTLRQSPAGNRASDVFGGSEKKMFAPVNEAELKRISDRVSSLPWTSGSDEHSLSSLEGMQLKIDLGGDKNGWDYADIDWQSSYINFYTGGYAEPEVSDYANLIDKDNMLCSIGSGPVQTITLPASELYVNPQPWGRLYLILERKSAPDDPYIILLYTDHWITIDDSVPGTLELQHLGRKYDPAEMSPEGRYHDLSFDPDSVIFIPTQSTDVALSMEAMDPDGNPYSLINENSVGYLGAMDILAWHTDDPGEKISLPCSWLQYNDYNDPGENDKFWIQMYEKSETSEIICSGKRLLRFGETTDAASGTLGVEAGRDNVIALQIVYANGKSSEVTYLTVHPAEIRVDGEVSIVTPDGTDLSGGCGIASAGPDDVSVVFTPDDAANALDLTFYAAEGFQHTDGSFSFGKGFVMDLQGDGSYQVKLPAADFWNFYDGIQENTDDYTGIIKPSSHSNRYLNGYYMTLDRDEYSYPAAYYVIYAKDEYDDIKPVCITDWGVVPDGTPPLFVDDRLYPEGSIETFADGTYQATFRIVDDSLYSCDLISGEPLDRPMTLEFFYDPDYAKAAEKPSARLMLKGVGDGFVWKDDAGNDMGIFEVTADIIREGAFDGINTDGTIATYAGGAQNVYMTVTVKGQISPRITAPMDMTLFVSATDAHGNTNGFEQQDPCYPALDNPGSVTAEDVTGVAPKVTGCIYKEIGAGSEPDDRALFVSFNTPVHPENSWIRPHEAEIEGYRTEWFDAFPVFRDGTWQISYSDAFGNTYAEELVLDDVFGEYGIDLGFSTLDYVSPETGVTVTAAADGEDETLSGRVAYTAGSRYEAVDSASVTFSQNVYEYEVIREKSGKEDILHIHIDNIVDGAPEETLFFYFEEFGEMYREGEQPQGETFAPVTVSYRTDRETSPVGNTTMTFRHGDADGFSFRYYDEATKTVYTLAGKLSDYGIDLGELVPYEDTEAPSVDLVSIWKQKGPGFVQAEAFSGRAEESAIAAAIDRCGTAQSYDFVVNASDYSDWKLVVKETEPSSLSFETAESDPIEGVEVQGNNVLVTETVKDAFYIVAVDHASADSAATADNFCCIRIPKGSYHFDTTPPQIETLTVADSLYSRIVYVKVTDADNDGLATSGMTIFGDGLLNNSDPGYEDYPYKLTIRRNDTVVTLTAADAAGNSSVAQVTVSGIDDTAPVLNITWSPCFRNVSGGGLDPANPAAGPVNTSVVAHVTSSKEIALVSAAVGETPIDFNAKSAALSWGSISYTSQRVTVRFDNEAGASVDLSITAPNGISTDANVSLNAGVIDKKAPVIAESLEKAKRPGFSVPYELRYSLSFDEDVYCMNGGTTGTVYNAGNPFTVTLTDNIMAEYLFTDKAGNISVYTVKPADGITVDNLAPEISLDLEDGANATNGTVSVQVTADEDVTLSASDRSVSCGSMSEAADGSWTGTVRASKNGTFRLTASDRAGNTAEATFTVNNIDKTLPLIRFERTTISVLQDSDLQDLKKLLDEGVSCWDNTAIREESLSFDLSALDLGVPGIYDVTYSVLDTAGNAGEAVRHVKVVNKNMPTITVDGVLTENNGVMSVAVGSHILAVNGVNKGGEPYTLKAVKGSWSIGQMKRVSEGISIGEDGSAEFSAPGFYTLYVLTQSRKSYRTLLYVE